MVNHDKLMSDLRKNFLPVLNNSTDGVYLWLDEKHMICNEKFAKMFGYSVKEVEKSGIFLEKFVASKDQQKFSKQYHTHIANLSRPVTFKFQALKKDGKSFLAETDMIPITFEGHALAYHFVRTA